MKHINTLIPDIYDCIKQKGGWEEAIKRQFADEVSLRLSEYFGTVGDDRKPTLRLSQMGPRCPCELWHMINKPELAQQPQPHSQLIFAYGHLIEALVLAFIKASGHTVEGEQDEVSVDGVLGHRDCIIDGCLVDIKSTTTLGLERFKKGTIKEDDKFGYLDQLDGYLVGSHDDPRLKVKDRGYLLAIDKQLGHMVIYEHRLREQSIRERIRDYKEIVKQRETPACTCKTVPDGSSGNIKLDTRSSYNLFKHCCFPSLRTFIYSDGPRYLTKVVKRPTNSNGPIKEVDKNGKVVYNG